MNRRKNMAMKAAAGLAAACAGMLASCELGPNYERPPLEVPTTYKSATTQAATQAHLATNWWVLFNDPVLTKLEEDSLANNPDLKAAVARVAEARAAARQVESEFYPQITFDPSVTWAYSADGSGSGASVSTSGSGSGGATVTSGGRGNSATSVRIPFDLGYEVDLWGQVARSLESADAATRATADQYATVMQTLEADVAQDYMNLRSFEAQDNILSDNLKLTVEQLNLTKRKLQAGIVGNIDVAQAQSQLDQLIPEQLDIRRQRQDTEHALAILTGRPPSAFSVATDATPIGIPTIPAGLPVEILRDRPDVASAEENLRAASAQIGVAITDFYPAVKLTSTAGYQSLDFQHALDWESAIFSIGPSVSLPIFEGGRLKAALAQAQAKYVELEHTYRSTVLAAFRDVEVSLTDVHMYSDELEAQHRAVESAREYLRLSRLEYEQGLVSYLQLLDADRTLLTNEVQESQLLNQRLVSTVLLIKALGGGWDLEHPMAMPPRTAATRGAATRVATTLQAATQNAATQSTTQRN